MLHQRSRIKDRTDFLGFDSMVLHCCTIESNVRPLVQRCNSASLHRCTKGQGSRTVPTSWDLIRWRCTVAPLNQMLDLWCNGATAHRCTKGQGSRTVPTSWDLIRWCCTVAPLNQILDLWCNSASLHRCTKGQGSRTVPTSWDLIRWCCTVAPLNQMLDLWCNGATAHRCTVAPRSRIKDRTDFLGFDSMVLHCCTIESNARPLVQQRIVAPLHQRSRIKDRFDLFLRFDLILPRHSWLSQWAAWCNI